MACANGSLDQAPALSIAPLCSACVIAAAVFLAGLLIVLMVVGQWVASGFGDLNQQRLLFLGVIFLVNGVQLGTTFYLLSIMALPRHLDQIPPQAAATGIPDA